MFDMKRLRFITTLGGAARLHPCRGVGGVRSLDPPSARFMIDVADHVGGGFGMAGV